MKRNDFVANLFSKMGAVCILAAIAVSLIAAKLPFHLFGSSALAEKSVRQFMEAFGEGNVARMNACLMDNQQLEAKLPHSSHFSELVWDAYIDSISYAFSGEWYASDSGLCRDVSITMLDTPGALEQLIDRYQRQYGVEIVMDGEEKGISILRDGSSSDFFTEVSDSFVERVLSETQCRKTVTLTLELVYYRNQWKILLNDDVLNLLTGGMSV